MWKAERFEGTEEKDPLEEMLDFVNAHRLQPGQFEFAVASDEEGYQYCVMLYTEEKVGAVPPEGARRAGQPAGGEAGRPSRFTPSRPPGGERGAGRPSFKPQAGGRGGRPYGGGRPGGRPGGKPGGRPGGGRGGGRPKGQAGGKGPR